MSWATDEYDCLFMVTYNQERDRVGVTINVHELKTYVNQHGTDRLLEALEVLTSQFWEGERPASQPTVRACAGCGKLLVTGTGRGT